MAHYPCGQALVQRLCCFRHRLQDPWKNESTIPDIKRNSQIIIIDICRRAYSHIPLQEWAVARWCLSFTFRRFWGVLDSIASLFDTVRFQSWNHEPLDYQNMINGTTLRTSYPSFVIVRVGWKDGFQANHNFCIAKAILRKSCSITSMLAWADLFSSLLSKSSFRKLWCSRG